MNGTGSSSSSTAPSSLPAAIARAHAAHKAYAATVAGRLEELAAARQSRFELELKRIVRASFARGVAP